MTAPRSWTYGTQLPVQMLSTAIADPWEAAATVDDLVTTARRAEATGHDFVGVCDHVALPDDAAARMGTTWFDTVATLGFLAAHTTSVRLCSTVYVAAYRHPLQTAKAFGTLDHLSGGRVILGVGAGHVAGEFAALGVPFAERGRILDETLAALRGVWDDEFVSFTGDRYGYDRVGVGPRPAAGSVPIWVGGMTPAAWRRVGRFGDGLIPMGNPLDQYPEIIATVRAAAAAAGRADAPIAIGGGVGAMNLTGGDVDGLLPVSLRTPDAAADAIRAALAVGIDVVHLRFRARSLSEYLEQFDAFAETVVPLVG